MRRRLAAVAATAVAFLLTAPAAALAHGIKGKTDLPIPRWLFAWGAGLVLAISFAALAVLWQRPRLQDPERRRLFRIPGWVDPVCGVVGVAVFGIVVYAGLAGSQNTVTNLDPTFVFVLFWVGLVFASVLFGDLFLLFSPWRALGRAVGWLAVRVGSGAPAPLPYPHRLGRWPAALGIVGFAWLELVYSSPDVPRTLAILMLVYAGLQLLGMGLFGVAEWTDKGDAFGTYFRLFSGLSPWDRREGVLYLRPPLSGLPVLAAVPGTVALLCTMIGSTTFDGFSSGPVWRSIAPGLEQRFTDLGAGLTASVELGYSVGLVGCILAVGLLYWIGVTGMRQVGEGHQARELARRFVHTLVPIAFAYAVAHYFSLLLFQGQATAYLISDPLGHGSDIFGTASAGIDYTLISSNGIWYVQVAALITGHVCGLVLAHDRAVAMYRSARDATRSQYWMLLVMIGFTSLGLWLLSVANT